MTDFALSAGEDFELLFTSPDDTLGASFCLMNQTVTRIGHIRNRESGMTLQSGDGTAQPLNLKGYEHFTL